MKVRQPALQSVGGRRARLAGYNRDAECRGTRPRPAASPAAVPVGGSRELQRAQQRLELIARYSKDLLTNLPVDEIEAEIRQAARHGTPDTTRTRSPPNGLRTVRARLKRASLLLAFFLTPTGCPEWR